MAHVISTQKIPLDKLHISPLAIRQFNPKTDKARELLESIKAHGVLSPIAVRAYRNPETNNVVVNEYDIIFGLHRSESSKLAGLSEIPAVVWEATDIEAQAIQFAENSARVSQTKEQERDWVLNIIVQNPALSLEQVAQVTGLTEQKVQTISQLAKLTPEAHETLKTGRMTFVNAINLARLPQRNQNNFIEAAIAQTGNEFSLFVRDALKEIKKDIRLGIYNPDAATPGITPNPLSKIKLIDLHNKIEQEFNSLDEDGEQYTFMSGQLHGLKQALQIDQDSIEARKHERDKKSAETAASRTKRLAENAAKRAQELQTKAKEAEGLLASVNN